MGLLPVLPYDNRSFKLLICLIFLIKRSSDSAHDKASDGNMALFLFFANFEEASTLAFKSMKYFLL